jgi:hypothetical protein
MLSRSARWVAPGNAVPHDEQGSYLFQVENGRTKRIDVMTGIETDQLTEVSGPFDPSLKVVALGNYEVRGGMGGARGSIGDEAVDDVQRLDRHASPSLLFLLLLLILAGASAAFSLPVTLFPNVSFPRVRLNIDAGDRPAGSPGSSPSCCAGRW